VQKNIDQQIDVYKQMNTTYWPFITKMTSIFNLTGNVTLGTISSLNGNIECALYRGKQSPINDTDRLNIRHLDSWYKQFTYIKDLAKAVNRDRFAKILSVFDTRIKTPNSLMKWTFLSGHDTDIIPAYNDLNFSSSKCIE
jgi:hypothetical protein